MSELPREVERMFTGHQAGPLPSFHELLVEFERQAGSGRKAAKLVGVDERTWRRWKSGASVPKDVNRSKFGRAERELRARKITNADLQIRTKERGSRGQGISERQRTLTAKNLRITDPGAAGRIRDAYVAGGAAAGAAAFLAEVNDRFYGRMLGDPTVDDMDADQVTGDYGFTILSVG